MCQAHSSSDGVEGEDQQSLDKMIINYKDLANVASQPSQRFDKEGPLLIRDRRERIFTTKEVFHERWFRLKGNLLFFCLKKNQVIEPVGLIVLEQCTITLDSNPEIPYSFTLVFQGDEQNQQLAALTEPELESWICSLHVASYGFLKSRFYSLKKRLKKKRAAFISAFGDTSAVQQICKKDQYADGFMFASQDDPFLELRLGCHNLKSMVKGVLPNCVVDVSLLTAPFRWMKFAQTEVAYSSSDTIFFTTISLTKSNVTMMTRIKFTVYNVIEVFTDTRVMLGECIISLGVLLQDNNASLRCPFWSLDRKEMGYLTVRACLLRDVVPRDWKRRVTSVSPEKSKPPKKPLAGPRRFSLPSNLTDSSNAFLYGNLKILYHELTSQSYRFPTKLGTEVSVHEIMGESKLAFLIPQQLLNIWIKEEQRMLSVLLNLGELRSDWHHRHSMAVERHLQQINNYLLSLDIIVNNKGIHLKRSSQKTDPQLEFVPVNLHLQRMIVQNPNSKRGRISDIITVGAFTASSQGLKRGGLLTLLSPNNCCRVPIKSDSDCCETTTTLKTYDNIRDVLDSDSLKKATETLIRVEKLETDIELDLQELINYAAYQSIEDLRSAIFSLKNKAHQLTQLSSPALVEESLAIWELARPSDLIHPQTANSRVHFDNQLDSNKCGSPKGDSPKLKRPQHLAVIKNISNFHHDVPSTIYISGSKSPSWTSGQKIKCQGCGPGQICTTPLTEFLPSPVGSPEEFEPLELTHLNIKASIMCMASKLKSLTKLSPESRCKCCWSFEFAPSVRKLRQAMKGLCRTAKLTYSLLALKESSQSLQSYSLRHRRDVVFSQALTSLISGILTRIWCQSEDTLCVEQLLSLGLLVQFEGLLSCYGENMAMLEDMLVAIHDLNRTLFWLEFTTSKTPRPRIEGNRVSLSVIIPVPSSVLLQVSKRNQRNCRLNVTCVFFNIGINEKADLGERLGYAALQDRINLDSYNQLKAYYQLVKSTNKAFLGFNECLSMEPSVASLLQQLKTQLQAKESKNVTVLHLAAQICCRLNGIRFTSCKSAKDRTGMSVTLEQMSVLQRSFHIDDAVAKRVLDSMRRCGTRRINTLKNIGVKKYAFNCHQVSALPKAYRPPLGTFENCQN